MAFERAQQILSFPAAIEKTFQSTNDPSSLGLAAWAFLGKRYYY
jgi:hypothetical protein